MPLSEDGNTVSTILGVQEFVRSSDARSGTIPRAQPSKLQEAET